MKHTIRILLLLSALALSQAMFSQPAKSRNFSAYTDGGNTPYTGKVRLSGGLTFLLLIGTAYGARKALVTAFNKTIVKP